MRLSSSKRNHHFLNGSWLSGYLQIQYMDSPVFRISDPGSCPNLIIAATGAMFEIRKVRISGLLDFQTFVLKRWFCHPDMGISCVLFFEFPIISILQQRKIAVSVCPKKRRQIRCDDCEEGSGNAVTEEIQIEFSARIRRLEMSDAAPKWTEGKMVGYPWDGNSSCLEPFKGDIRCIWVDY